MADLAIAFVALDMCAVIEGDVSRLCRDYEFLRNFLVLRRYDHYANDHYKQRAREIFYIHILSRFHFGAFLSPGSGMCVLPPIGFAYVPT